jgi:hypothetical protein
MLLGRYQFNCRFETEARLPAFKGSTFRGAFGSALKSVVCAVREKDCRHCLLASNCIYARVFEPKVCSEENPRLRQATAPHPYVIEPPRDLRSHYAAGDEFSFELLLFGEFNQYLSYFIYAFEAMGERGLGGLRKRGMGRYFLESVSCENETVYHKNTRQLVPPAVADLKMPEPCSQKGQLDVFLLTPLRLKFENHLQADLPFHLLVRSALRRISSVFNCFGSGEPPLDYRGLVARANEVPTVSSQLDWVDWKRYSQRQEQTMLMGGMSGSVCYDGDLSEFLPLLDVARHLHLGKQTAFGLGLIDYRLKPVDGL